MLSVGSVARSAPRSSWPHCWRAAKRREPRLGGIQSRQARTKFRPAAFPSPRSRPACRTDGDPTGMRKWLADRGVVYGFEYTNDVLSNVRGGTQTGTIDQGKLQGILTVDFDKLAGWSGLYVDSPTSFHSQHRPRPSRLCRRPQHHRRDRGGADDAAFRTLARAEVRRTTRQASRSARSPRTPSSSTAKRASCLLQSDWPTIAAVNLPSGGAAYPLSTPGVRFKVDPVKDVYAACSQCSTAIRPGPVWATNSCATDTGSTSASGPAILIGEAQFRRNYGKEDAGLATRSSSAAGGMSASSTTSASPLAACCSPILLAPASRIQHRGNSGLYAVIDQQLYRPKGGDARAAFRCSPACRSARPIAI